MTKSMACPFCGMKDEACYVNGLNGANVYQCQWCGAQALCQEDWETRPLEESLRDKNEILQSKLAREHQVSDALYLLLVDDPNTKLQADQILINIFGKCEPSPSDVSVTQDVSTDVETGQSIENTNPDYYKQEIARLTAELAELWEMMRWHKYPDEKPETYGVFLVTNGSEVWEATYQKYRLPERDNWDETVTHWMPMAEPPEAD